VRQIVVAFMCAIVLLVPAAPRPTPAEALGSQPPEVLVMQRAIYQQPPPSGLVHSDPPALTGVLFQDELKTPELFWPDTCTTGLGAGTFYEEGLHVRIAGRCYPGLNAASMGIEQPDVRVGDGEASVEFRLESSSDRARFGLDLWNMDQAHLVVLIDVSDDTALIAQVKQSGIVPLGQRQGVGMRITPGGWTTLAMRKLGSQVWVLINDQPFMQVEDQQQIIGAVRFFSTRAGTPDGPGEMTLSLRNAKVSSVEGADPGRVPPRAERPVVDPRFNRITDFIKVEIAGAPGNDARAEELRTLGKAALAMLEDTKVNLTVGDLPESTMARYELVPRNITVSERLLGFTPHVASMLLLHEAMHAQQHQTGEPSGCVDREVEAYQWGSRLWRAWFGTDGKVPPGDDIEAQFTGAVQADNKGTLRAIVTERYRAQCAGR
jgi:hypothetical protein